jgi:uncharacterized protein YjcR
MATDTKSTREQVEELMNKGMEAKEIAEKTGKTPATVYVHIRNINAERGVKPRGRGRPPKVQTDGESKPATRKAPPKSDSKSDEAPKKRGRPPGSGKKSAGSPQAADNGHHTSAADRFPAIKAAIESELSDKRREVQTLEGMLAAIEK